MSVLFILKDQSRSSANLENKGAPMVRNIQFCPVYTLQSFPPDYSIIIVIKCMDLLSDCPVIGAEDGTVAIYSYNASRADGSLVRLMSTHNLSL